MLPASVPMSGNTPTSKADKSLRSLFCGAANHLTQLYMSSLKLEKGATKKGYCRAVEDLIKFLQLQQQYGRTISIESLVDHLKTKKREILQRDDNDFGDEEDEHEEGDETPVLGVPLGENKPPGSAPLPFGASTRSLASQFEGLSATGGSTFNSSDLPRMGAEATGVPSVHFGFASAAPPGVGHPQTQPAQHPGGGSASSSTSSTSAQFPSSTFRDAVSLPFSLGASSSASASASISGVGGSSSNPFAPLGSNHQGSVNGRKRQYFEFFFDAPPNLTLSSAAPASNGGVASTANVAGGFHFVPSHSTSTSISPAPSTLVGTASANGGEGDGAMDFSCYEHQAWKRYRRDEDHQHQQQQQQHNAPSHRTSANTS